MRIASQLLSVLFHPLLVVLYAYALLFALGTYHAYLPLAIKRVVLFVVAIDTVIIPLLIILLLKHLGWVSSVTLDDPRERLLPLALTVVVYVLTLYLLRRFGLSLVLLKLLLAGTLVLLSALGISAWWKISCHAMGMGGLVAFMLWASVVGLFRAPLLLLIGLALSGLLLAARLLLGAHSPAQIYTGYAVGMVVSLAVFVAV